MSEWWTYRPSDFLMFSARTYARLVEMANLELWPLQGLLLVVGAALAWIAVARPREGARTVALVLAPVWLGVGWAFHWQRFAPINSAATWLALAFALQAALLLVLSGWRASPSQAASMWARRAGLALAIGGVLLYPLLAPLTGRPWHQAEVFGLMPEPTALTTLGLLLATDLRYRLWLMVIPVLSLVLGLGTLWLLYG